MSDGMSEGARYEREARHIRETRRSACRVLLAWLRTEDAGEYSPACLVTLAGAVKTLLCLADNGTAEARVATLGEGDEAVWRLVLDAACRALPTLSVVGDSATVMTALQAGDHDAWARLLVEAGDREIFDAEARHVFQGLSPFAGQVLLVIVRESFNGRDWTRSTVPSDVAAYLEALADRDGRRVVVRKPDTYPAERHTLLVLPPVVQPS